jgi:membrane-bound lytic murein transglycosylase D
VLRKMQYRAGKRDNVNTIAHRFGVPAAKVAEWNRVNLKANFKPGQTIVVWRLVPAGSGGGSKLARR